MTNFDKHADDLMRNLIQGVVEANAAGIEAGVEVTERRMVPALRALEREFFAALIDPETKMKSSLQLAIMNVLMVVPSAITDRVNRYAGSKIAEAKADPYKDRPDLDMGPNGQTLRAGS